jgi:hypothetical protein
VFCRQRQRLVQAGVRGVTAIDRHENPFIHGTSTSKVESTTPGLHKLIRVAGLHTLPCRKSLRTFD